MSKDLLIINKAQFGYHTDVLKWCQYLYPKYRTFLVCYDTNNPKKKLDGVNVLYAKKRFGIDKYRALSFFLLSFFKALFFSGPIIIVYFKGCEYLKKIIFWKKIILDIRTLSINPDENARNKENKEILKACMSFNFVSIISDGIKNQLKLPPTIKQFIIPLGAETVSDVEKCFDVIRLLYVGTLSGRDVDKTVEGLALFLKKGEKQIEYHIVGTGDELSVKKLYESIDRNGMSNYVKYHGYVRHDMLKPYFDKCNIGVSFIPITTYYQDQPPTKTFEYILSGLYTIATKTRSNMEIVGEDNGVLIEDNSLSFGEALEYIEFNLNHIKGLNIVSSLKQYTWEKIINNQFIPMLKSIE